MCRNTRRHLPDRWILFRGKKLVHLDRAWVSDAAQIVTHHVGDHQVFSAVLDGRRQPMPLGLIFYRVGFILMFCGAAWALLGGSSKKSEKEQSESGNEAAVAAAKQERAREEQKQQVAKKKAKQENRGKAEENA